MNGKAKETFPLKVFQSVDERQPAVEPLATAQVRAEALDPMTEIGWESDRAPEAVSEVVATDWIAPLPAPYKRLDEVKVEAPVPPPVTLSVPVTVGVKVKAPAAEVIFVP